MSVDWPELMAVAVGLAIALVAGVVIGRWWQRGMKPPPEPTGTALGASREDRDPKLDALALRSEEMTRMLRGIEGQVERLRWMLDERLPRASGGTGQEVPGDSADGADVEPAAAPHPAAEAAPEPPVDGAKVLEDYRRLIADPTDDGFLTFLESFGGALVEPTEEGGFSESRDPSAPLVAVPISAEEAFLLPSRAILAHYGSHNRMSTLRPKLDSAYDLSSAPGGGFLLKEAAVAAIDDSSFWLRKRGQLSGLVD